MAGYRKGTGLSTDFFGLAAEIADLLSKKDAAYGSAFSQSGEVLKLLFPDGVPPEKYHDCLAITRILDKLFRIATDKNAFSEDPWRDIAGYAILSLRAQKTRKDNETT